MPKDDKGDTHIVNHYTPYSRVSRKSTLLDVEDDLDDPYIKPEEYYEDEAEEADINRLIDSFYAVENDMVDWEEHEESLYWDSLIHLPHDDDDYEQWYNGYDPNEFERLLAFEQVLLTPVHFMEEAERLWEEEQADIKQCVYGYLPECQ